MFSWRRSAPRERRRRKHLGGSGGMLPRKFLKQNFKTEYSETPFPAFLRPRKQFPRQCWCSLKFCKLLNKNSQLVGGGGGGGGENGNNRIFLFKRVIWPSTSLYVEVSFLFPKLLKLCYSESCLCIRRETVNERHVLYLFVILHIFSRYFYRE